MSSYEYLSTVFVAVSTVLTYFCCNPSQLRPYLVLTVSKVFHNTSFFSSPFAPLIHVEAFYQTIINFGIHSSIFHCVFGCEWCSAGWAQGLQALFSLWRSTTLLTEDIATANRVVLICITHNTIT